MLNIQKIREDFPILKKRRIIYFDNACTTLKCQQVIDAIVKYYSEYSGCAGRSNHTIAKETELAFEGARQKVAKFIGAKDKEIVWTKNTTEAMNLIAHSMRFENGDKVLTTNLEHHSVLLPFYFLSKKGKVVLEHILMNKDGTFNSEDFNKKIDEKTKLVVIHHTSNTMGTTSPFKEIIKIAHDSGALVLMDAAQGLPHYEVNVKKMDVDFMGFSGHKMLGPTGIGCLYGKYSLLEELPPFITGGETIREVKLDKVVLEEPPHKFEGGIQHYSGVIGLGAAVDYLLKIGMKNIESYEKELAKYLLEKLSEVDGIKIYGTTDYKKKCALVSFNIKDASPHDIAIMLDTTAKIAVRSGMFCAQPAMEYLGAMKGAVRASLYLYNTKEEIDKFVEELRKIIKIF